MRSWRTMTAWLAAWMVGAASFTSNASAQLEIKSGATEITLTGRVHAQFNTTSVATERSSEFLIRRTRLVAEVAISDFVTGKVEPDFGAGRITLQDAYVRLTFSPAFRATFGQFKRPFDRFELHSSTIVPVIERGGRIRGVTACTGVGGICALTRFNAALQYSARDIGVMLDGTDRTGRVSYMVSATNGTGFNQADENGGKSFGGRVEVAATSALSVAASVAVHDYLDPADQTEYATAFGADLEVGDYDAGLHVLAGGAVGDNWRNLVAGAPSTYVSAQAIVTYKIPTTNRFVEAVEPIGRVSWGDPDTDTSGDHGWLLTPGFQAFFTGRNKIAANLDVWAPNTGNTEVSFKMQAYLYF